jgi:hypothetical protein
MINIYIRGILIEKPFRECQIGRTRMKWEVNIKVNLRKIVCEDRRWMKMGRDPAKWPTLV